MDEGLEVTQTNALLKAKLLKWLVQEERIATAIDGLMLSRINDGGAAESCFYQPMVALVVQGFKRSMIGNEEYNYGEEHCMVVGVDMPGIYHITKASSEEPFLSMSLKLDRYIITQLLAELPPLTQSGSESPKAIVVSETPLAVLKAFIRLVDLLDTPERIPVLAPMIIREIHFHLLTDIQSDCLRMASIQGSQVSQIASSINWLRDNYMNRITVDELAQRVNMSSSTFHRHFQQVTSLSPLQFQKRLRLYEAERLMLLENKDASTAALGVGYESHSQFTREYKRQFGETPYQDISQKLVRKSLSK